MHILDLKIYIYILDLKSANPSKIEDFTQVTLIQKEQVVEGFLTNVDQ
jgi:hypothetical protein